MDTAPLPPDITISDPGPIPTLSWMALSALVVDPRYQRTTGSVRSRANIRQIAEAFTWAKFQPVTVTPAAIGAYAVIDGQHRIEAARMRPDITMVPCWIVSAPEVRAQARAFVGINRDRVAPTPIQMHHAAVAAGDPDALHITEVCAKAGVTIPTVQTASADLLPGHTLALAAIRTGLATFGDGPVIAALSLLREAWSDRRGQMRGSVISATIQFFAVHKGREIDRDRLIRALTETSALELEDQARALKTAFRGSITIAMRQILTRTHNKGLREDRRLPETL